MSDFLSLTSFVLTQLTRIDMGWWMAKNLRRSLPREKLLFNIYDIQPTILEKFASEFSDGHSDIVCCSSSKEIAEKSVS